jgi:hypothetical protein
MRAATAISIAILGSCAFSAACEDGQDAAPLDVCDPVLDSLEPSAGPVAGGTEVTLRGLWVATDYGERDTLVELGGREADVLGVFRGDGCISCDQCTVDALRCEECERVCRGLRGWTDTETGAWRDAESCEEWVAFVTPAADAAGEAGLVLTNVHGSAQGLKFTYE